jgi:putative ubiquitin-RnfH superfamily antitoxin RatB of RatAB toxin-antitoxin module
MAEAEFIHIEVVCALPDQQKLVSLTVPAGTTARQAVVSSGICADFPQVDMASCPLGIFGKEVEAATLVREGDRIEVYRPLLNDPRDTRRKLAARGLTMGPESQE